MIVIRLNLYKTVLEIVTEFTNYIDDLRGMPVTSWADCDNYLAKPNPLTISTKADDFRV